VNLPANLEPQSYSIRDDLTYSFDKKGRHDVRTGGEFLYNPDHIFIAFNGFGTLDAQNGPVPANIEALFPVWDDVSTWNIAALSPLSRQYTRGTGNFDTTTTRKIAGFWVQDDWSIGPSVTLNLGVRYDLQIGALSESKVLDPFMPTDVPSDTNNFAPRLGFAWSVDDRTVVRGGYGRFFAEVSDNFASFTTAQLEQINATVLYDGRADFASNPFNGPVPTFEQVEQSLCTVSTASNCIRRSINNMRGPNLEIPYAHQASIGLQRQLASTLAFTSDYVFIGNRHEVTSQNINLSYNPATGANFPFANTSLRPYPQWGTVSMTFTNARANTHSWQSSFTKRFSGKWQASGTYTLSGLWDSSPQPYSGLNEVPFPVTPDLGNEYTLAVSDQRHRAVFNGIWEVGWGFQLSGLYFFGSGERYATTWGGDARQTGGTGGRLRPDGTIVPRNNFVGKPIHRVDLRIQHGFSLGGRTRVESILETFNLFNHANFGAYSTQESVPATYGTPVQNVNQAYLPRVLQLGFRLTF
jgi:TonB-dependent receptor-like protein